jgi:MFS family permease
VAVGLIIAIISSLGAPLITTIARSDHVSLFTGEWVLTAALLSGAVATPVMGRLADGSRQRDIVVVGLFAVIAGSVLAALSPSFALLVVGRALQGIGLGVLPVTMAIARTHLPSEQASRTIAALSVSAATGVGLGYPITSAISDAFDYRVAFWFGAFLVAAALAAIAVVAPRRVDAPERSFDTRGVLTLSLAVTGILIVLSEGSAWAWFSPRVVIIVLISFALLVIWISHELHTADPLVDLRQVKHRSVLTADVCIFLISVAMYLFIPVVVEFVQAPKTTGYGVGASVLVAGLMLTPLSIGTILAARCLPTLLGRFGTRAMIPLGALIFAASALFFALDHDALWQAFGCVGVAGIGVGFTYGAMPGSIIRAVPATETGSATGFYQVLQRTGGSVGSALSAAVLAAFTRHGQSSPTVGGFVVALYVASGLCAFTAVLSYVLPGRASAPPAPTARSTLQRISPLA